MSLAPFHKIMHDTLTQVEAAQRVTTAAWTTRMAYRTFRREVEKCRLSTRKTRTEDLRALRALEWEATDLLCRLVHAAQLEAIIASGTPMPHAARVRDQVNERLDSPAFNPTEQIAKDVWFTFFGA